MLVHESLLGSDNLLTMNLLCFALGSLMLVGARSLHRAAVVLACFFTGAAALGVLGANLDADAAGLWICGTLGGLMVTLMGTGVLMFGQFIVGGLVTGGVVMIALPDLSEPNVLTDPWVIGIMLCICNIGGLLTAASRERGVIVATTIGGAVLLVDSMAWLSGHDVVEAIIETNLFTHEQIMLALVASIGVWTETKLVRSPVTCDVKTWTVPSDSLKRATHDIGDRT